MLNVNNDTKNDNIENNTPLGLDEESCSESVKNTDSEKIGGKISVVIDGKETKVPLRSTILDAAAEIGIKIPTLCHHEDLCVAGACRICMVEVEGERTLQASCAYPITKPVRIKTHSRRIRQARQHILELLLSKHYGECLTCFRNDNCELQSLAKEYGVDSLRFGHPEQPLFEKDTSGYAIVRDMNKCILCMRCVRTCGELQGIGALGPINRGAETEIAAFAGNALADTLCINCGQCINRCPTGALRTNDMTDEVWKAIDDPDKHVVIQTAPAPRAGIGEEFGLEPGHPLTFEMNTALRSCGFDKVFDTNFSADLTIIEEGTELILRLYGALVKKDSSALLPQFTSCSPGWVKYIEHFYPEYLSNVSSCKSPQQMFGAVIKTYYAQLKNIDPEKIIAVSLMPCTAKKFESHRPEMGNEAYADIDYVLTTRELAQMIRENGIDLPKMEKSDFDTPFGSATGSGVIFAATGGVMEAALRTVFELVTGQTADPDELAGQVSEIRGFEGVKYKELTLPEDLGPVPDILKMNKDLPFDNWDWLKGATLKLAVCHGTANAKKVMEDIKAGGKFSECHFIEFMACPGGCLGGGGQPIPTSPEIRKARARAIYAEDQAYDVRKSHENPAIAELYTKFLTDGPNGHSAHKLLHTHYTPRGKYIEEVHKQ
jgi:NADP-reducing hydrogenase subunit HndD